MIDSITPSCGLSLPHPDNDLQDDVLRIRASFFALDSKIAALDAALRAARDDFDALHALIDVRIAEDKRAARYRFIGLDEINDIQIMTRT